MIKSTMRYIQALPSYRLLEYLFLIFVMISTFFQGGENEYILYAVPFISALYVILRKRVTFQPADIFIISAILLVAGTAIFRSTFNSHTIIFVLTAGAFLILKSITFNQKFFIHILIIFSIIHSTILIVQRVVFSQIRPASTFVNPNWIAVWLLVAFYYLVFEKNIFQKYPIRFVAAIMILVGGLYVSFSRTTIVILLFFLAYLIYKKKLIDRRYFLVAAFSAIILLSALIYQRLSQDKSDPFAYSRISIYKSAYAMFVDKPLVGFGPGNVEHVLPKYFKGEKTAYSMNAKVPKMSHSTFFEVPLVMGGIGAVLLFCGIVFSLKKRMYGLPIAFILIAALFNNIEKSFSLCLLFAIVISFGTHDKAWYYRFRPYYSKIVFFIVTYICLLQMISYYLYSIAREEKDQVKVFTLLRRAQKLSPYDPFYVDEYTQFLTMTTLNIPQGQRLAAIERYFTIHKKLMPYDSTVRFHVSLHYFDLLSRLKQSNVKEILQMEPEVRMRLHLELEALMKEWPRNARYHYLMLLVLESENNISGALKKAREIVIFEPEFYRVHSFIAKHSTLQQEKLYHAERMSEIAAYPKEKATGDYERYIIATE